MNEMITRNYTPEEVTTAERPDRLQWHSPAVDILEDFDQITVVANIPGVLREDVDVTFDKGVLKIRGRVRTADHDGEYLLREVTTGGYERKFRISEMIDADGIHAEYDNGVLMLRLPKSDGARPRSIPVVSGALDAR